MYLELQTLKDRLAHEASHDALTELPNRRRFHEELERMCGRGRADDSIAVLFLDLDGFKDVNDQFGHDVGNELLVEVAARLRSCVRPGDIVARMGGDEFTIMLTRIDNPAPAIEVADRICAILTEQFILDAGVVADLDEHRDRARTRRHRRSGRPRTPRRRGDVPRQVTGKGGLGDGSGLGRSCGDLEDIPSGGADSTASGSGAPGEGRRRTFVTSGGAMPPSRQKP